MSDDFDPNSFAPGPATGTLPAFAAKLPTGAQQFIKSHSPSDDDEGVIATFEKVEVFQPFKSKEASDKEGKAVEIFDMVTFVRINVRGNDKLEVHRPVSDADKRRFPFAWQQYERGLSHMDMGTQLSAIGMDASTVRIMQARNVYTVEDMALVNDINLQNLGAGAREWRHKAKTFVEARAPKLSSTDQQVTALSAQLGEALAMMKTQAEESAALRAELEVLKAKRPVGRPPNASREPQES